MFGGNKTENFQFRVCASIDTDVLVFCIFVFHGAHVFSVPVLKIDTFAFIALAVNRVYIT